MKKISRRAALAKLGIAATVAYTAPVVTRIDTAKAAFPSSSCNFRGNGVGGGCGGGRTGNRGRGNGRG